VYETSDFYLAGRDGPRLQVPILMRDRPIPEHARAGHVAAIAG
jgi:hypothetical protein